VFIRSFFMLFLFIIHYVLVIFTFLHVFCLALRYM
jgi:hypothetical protein